MRQDTQIFVYCFNPGQDVIQALERIPGIKLRVFNRVILGQWGRYLDAWPIGGYLISLKKLIRDFFSLLELVRVQRQLKHDAPFIIYANSSIFRPLLAILSLIGFRNIAKFCHLRERGKFDLGLVRKTINTIIEASFRVTYIAITEDIKNYATKVTKNDVNTIYNPIVVEHSNRTKAANYDGLQLLFLGGFQSNKGLLEFLTVMDQNPITQNVEVHIAGGEGPEVYRTNCQRLMRQINQKWGVTFNYLGAVTNISSNIENADYIIIWHSFPHFSRCIVEAQMLMTKVFTKRDPVVCEQLAINSSGIYLYDLMPEGKKFLDFLEESKNEVIDHNPEFLDYFSVSKHVETIDSIVREKLT